MNDLFPKYRRVNLDGRPFEIGDPRGRIYDFERIHFQSSLDEEVELPLVTLANGKKCLSHVVCGDVIRKWNAICNRDRVNYRYKLVTEEEWESIIENALPDEKSADKPQQLATELW